MVEGGKQIKAITPLFLKTYGQKFDLMTIFMLEICNKGISQIGSLPECLNL
jgi:hypothetical protein